MRKNFLLICFLFGVLFSGAQSNDPALNKRLSEYISANEDLNLEKIMDFIHPKLFEIAPRELMIKALKEVFESDEFKASMDSLEIISVDDEFKYEGISYRKVQYSMVMDFRFVDAEKTSDSVFVNLLKTSFSNAFNDAIVSFDKEKNSFHIKGYEFLIAIKDKENALWMFIGHEKNKMLMEYIFPKAVIEKFNLL